MLAVIASFVRCLFVSRSHLKLENIALRHQLAVYQRSGRGRQENVVLCRGFIRRRDDRMKLRGRSRFAVWASMGPVSHGMVARAQLRGGDPLSRGRCV